MNEKTIRTGRIGNRQGVALILVIGMLALMMIAGMTFAIFMRTERVAAGNFRNDVQARQLLDGALARALNDIELSVGSNPYPPWNFIQSVNGTETNMTALNGFTNWIPWSVIEGTNLAPRWENVTVPFFEGRVSYVVLNCSGLLDANYAGGGARGAGTNAVEIQTGLLPEVGSLANAAALALGRPYESGQDLCFRALASGALLSLPKTLTTYSAFPLSYPGGTNLSSVDISGDAAALRSRQADIVNAFIRSGISALEAPYVFTNLLDYVDSSSPVPSDLESSCTKAVPMINELRVTNAVQLKAGGLCVPFVLIDAEWFYPFMKASPNSYRIAYDVTVSGMPGTPPQFIPASVSQNMDSGYTANADVMAHKKVTFGTVVAPISTNGLSGVQFIIKVGLKVLCNGQIVDSVPYPYVAASYFCITGNVMSLNSLDGGCKGYECVDPRFNWDPRPSAQQWVAYSATFNPYGSLNTTNYFTRAYVGAIGSPAVPYLEMHVAGESLKGVGELAYLTRGKSALHKWSTIKICLDRRSGIPIDRVFDNFIVNSNRNGLVNLNSRSLEALAAIFSGMPLDRYPGESGVSVVSAAQAYDLAVAMTNHAVSWANLSDFGQMTNMMGVGSLGSLTPLQAQSIFRNSAGLMHPRQNYFVVLVCAETTKNVVGLGASVISGLRGVAEIWRDPLPNSQGQHLMFVRSFKVLNL